MCVLYARILVWGVCVCTDRLKPAKRHKNLLFLLLRVEAVDVRLLKMYGPYILNNVYYYIYYNITAYVGRL